MKLQDLFLAPVFLFVIGTFMLGSRAPEAAPAPTAQLVGQEDDDDGRHVGVISDWRMQKDGTVYLLLEGRSPVRARPTGERRTREASVPREDDDEIERLWFKTPPIQGQQVHFQDLTLMIILHSQQRETTAAFSIWGDPTPTSRGESMENAITISMIGPG